ncbi:endonuclease/exonuclease/phosphatase family protein [Streptomyces sp. NPDC006460]|uniref:endonuclease/exonuclease/phosphatase family protein n=1 Tax=Streptomyces sp. NPDC006460 TaxID=3154304 RepID=UPI0033B61463
MMRLRALIVALLAATMLGGLVTSASADTVSPKSASVLRFLSYNICGGNDELGTPCGTAAQRDAVKVRVDLVKRHVTEWDADIVFLQEVCKSQYDEVLKALAPLGYSGTFTTMIPVPVPSTGDLCKSNSEPAFDKEHPWGNAVFAKGPVTVLAPLDLTVGGEKAGTTWKSSCVQVPLQGRATRACSVHLYSYNDAIRIEQAKKLAGLVKPWIDAGTPVVLGGDFNAQHWANRDGTWYTDPRLSPMTSLLDPFYSHSGGTGQFLETDETDAQRFTPECQALNPPAGHCRSGANTVLRNSDPLTESKYDYIFVSKDHFKNVVADAMPRESLSDHYPYRGAATWSHCNNPADGKADLLRRGADGSLYRHFGGRSDKLLQSLYCKVGAGWNADWSSMRQLARAGDVDGDGAEDLYAIDSTGNLRFFPGDPTETFFRWPRTVATGYGTVDQLAVSADMDGDGTRDLVTRLADGTLQRRAIQPDGTVGSPVAVTGDVSWKDYDTILTPGDLTGDGAPDLLARTPAGDLYLYEATAGATLHPRVKIAWGWNVYDGISAPGDVDGDGKADLLARDTAGNVYFYAGLGTLNGTIAFADRFKSGWGFPTGDTLF